MTPHSSPKSRIAGALGIDDSVLLAAVDEALAEPDCRRRSGVVRKHLPFELVAEKAGLRIDPLPGGCEAPRSV